MKRQKQIKINKQSGAAMLIAVIFFVFISLAIISGLVTPSIREFKIATDSLRSRQSFFLSESGAEDVFYRLKESLPVDTSETITLNGNTATTTIADIGSGEKMITSVGDVNSRQRSSKIVISVGTGVSFNYGIQSGQDGISLAGNSQINGSVYSNGNIHGSGSITGSATAANYSAPIADQVNNSGDPLFDIRFGYQNSSQDFAQSFKLSNTDVINKVRLYLKKIGDPSNLTIRIVQDHNGLPGDNTITSGDLSASLVSTTYSWIDVFFSSNPELIAGTTYWIVIDGSTSSSKYYAIKANNNSYTNGVSKLGKYKNYWFDNTVGKDGFFEVYLGGVSGVIDGPNIGSMGVGNAYAHTIDNATVAGTKYCQTTNNIPMCDTSLADPVPLSMPISDQNILDWKAEAELGGVYTGNYIISETTTLGPKKITRDLTIANNTNLTLTGIIWVEGNLKLEEGATVSLDSGYGSSEGLIISDGTVKIDNNVVFNGSGDPDSYIMVLTTSSSLSAVDIKNNVGSAMFYAPNGTIVLNNGSTVIALTGKHIDLKNGAIVNYNSGLINSNFTNGPSGSWSVSTWKETQ